MRNSHPIPHPTPTHQVDRYDSLSEDMELLRQKCKGLLAAEREDFTKQVRPCCGVLLL